MNAITHLARMLCAIIVEMLSIETEKRMIDIFLRVFCLFYAV